jgi:hypothetical protein
MIQKILQAASLIINGVIGAAAIFTNDPIVTKIGAYVDSRLTGGLRSAGGLGG